MKHKLLFVDDEVNILKSIERLFEDEEYELYSVLSGEEALRVLNQMKISLIVSDYRMPDIDGIELLKKAASVSPETIRVMLTGYADIDVVIEAVNQGEVSKYITKPWNDEEMKRMIRNCLSNYEKNQSRREIKGNHFQASPNPGVNTDSVIQKLKEHQEKLNKVNHIFDQSFYELVRLLVECIERWIPFLGLHLKNVSQLAVSMARHIKWSSLQIRELEYASMLHDIGKVFLPKELILFNGLKSLSSEEKKLIETHPAQGAKMIETIPLFKKVSTFVLFHHEHRDGSGYPFGKKNEEIPIESRIIRLADEWDHLTNSEWGEGKDDALALASFLHCKEKWDMSLYQVMKTVIQAGKV